MLKKVTLASVFFVFWSCMNYEIPLEEPLKPEPYAQNGRLVFSSTESFINYLGKFEKGNTAELERALSFLAFVPLKTAVHEVTESSIADEFDQAHLSLLNRDRLLQIGEEVILYKNQKKYYLSADVFDAGVDWQEFEMSGKIGSYKATNLTVDMSEEGRFFNAPLDGDIGVGGAQYEFTLPDGSFRKFVNEFWSFSETLYPIQAACSNDAYLVRQNLYLRIKLEGRPSRKRSWTSAPEPPDVAYNLSLSDIRLNFYPPCSPGLASTLLSPVIVADSGRTSNGIVYVHITSWADSMEDYLSYISGSWTGFAVGSVTQTYLGTGTTWTDNF
jgi:hypothetical protein